MLFEKQSYVAHLENPAINDVVKGGKIDSLALQKFLLATDLLQDSIQENLGMIVTDGGFNNASIRRALHTSFSQFIFKTGRFPGSKNLAIVPMGVMPSFVKTNEVISAFDLYEKFNSTSVHCLVSTQFLAAFNIFIGGNKTISKKCNEWIFS